MYAREKEHFKKRLEKRDLQNKVFKMYQNGESIESIMLKTGYSRSGAYKIIQNLMKKGVDKPPDIVQYNATQHNITL